MSSENKFKSPQDPLCQRAAWHDRCGAYNNTAAGYLGKKRPTMLNNPLLARNNECGRQNKTFFAPDIGENFAHGDDYRDIFNVGHAISGWTGIVGENKRRENKPDGPRPRDYMSMNRAATAHGVSNARELRDFKDTHEVFRPGAAAGSQKKPAECRPAARVVDREAVYGDPTVPDKSSMKHLLSTKYGDDWLKCQPKRLPNQKADKPVYDYTKYYQNRACDLRHFMTHTKVPTELWQMPKFTKKAKPAISTFRTELDELASWRNHQCDRVGREGTKGQGIRTEGREHKDFIHCPKESDVTVVWG